VSTFYIRPLLPEADVQSLIRKLDDPRLAEFNRLPNGIFQVDIYSHSIEDAAIVGDLAMERGFDVSWTPFEETVR
jgi:hypothetical protein